jgi:hypothetical protein
MYLIDWLLSVFVSCLVIMNSKLKLIFQVLTAASMKFRIVFWDVLPCKIIVDRRFRGTLDHQGWWRQHVPLKRRSTIILQGSTSRNTILNFKLILIVYPPFRINFLSCTWVFTSTWISASCSIISDAKSEKVSERFNWGTQHKKTMLKWDPMLMSFDCSSQSEW